jgi:transposase
MEVIFTHCAGLDVPKTRVMACRMTPDPLGQQAEGLIEVREFGTLTVDLRSLSDGLAEAGITHVAMESTGEYWQPVFNLLEGTVHVVLVNASHVKRVPGRKTDKADARWLAKLMRHGLLQASFIPPAGQRDVRAVPRYRTQLVPERSREVNRVHGVLERANIQLASVATDSMGVSGRAILAAFVEGRADPATMAELAQRRRRSKIPLREQALTGLVRAHHRRLWASPWAHMDFLDEQIEALSGEITRCLTEWRAAAVPTQPPASLAAAEGAATPATPGEPLTCTRALALLDTIPGVDRRGAERWVAEPGVDMARFGTAARLAAWVGVAPGNDARAGKQRSGRTRPGNQPLRTVLTQLAHAAAPTKGPYLSALSHRLAARRGRKRAIIAVAHAMVVRAFYLFVRQETYHDLGATYVDEQRRHHVGDRLMRRIEPLGYHVHLEPRPMTAS